MRWERARLRRRGATARAHDDARDPRVSPSLPRSMIAGGVGAETAVASLDTQRSHCGWNAAVASSRAKARSHPPQLSGRDSRTRFGSSTSTSPGFRTNVRAKVSFYLRELEWYSVTVERNGALFTFAPARRACPRAHKSTSHGSLNTGSCASPSGICTSRERRKGSDASVRCPAPRPSSSRSSP